MDPPYWSYIYAQAFYVLTYHKQITRPWCTSEYSVTSWTPVFMYCERGHTKAGRGEGCQWSIWGQLPVGDGQGSCCQDVWQTPDEPY